MKKKVKDTAFQFKQFAVHHNRCTMKVGTDAVLLGAWADISNTQRILDIGTGSGVIALMLSQRSSSAVQIDAVEIEHADASQAKGNVFTSPWANRIAIHEVAIQNYFPDVKYDMIVTNPPYFNNSFQPPDQKRLQTRHTVSLSFDDLIAAAARLLTLSGKFNIILPYTEGIEFIALAEQEKFFCSRQWRFRARKEKPVERLLLEFQFEERKQEEGEIIHYTENGEWSEDYKVVTKDFYLKL